MLRFYNGMTPETLDNMSVIDFDQYWYAITKIEAHEMLIDLTTVDYPHLKPGRRREIWNNLKSNEEGSANKKGYTNARDIARALGAIQNGR